MPANIVVGTQWGDEGKGKIIDILASRADVVVRSHILTLFICLSGTNPNATKTLKKHFAN